MATELLDAAELAAALDDEASEVPPTEDDPVEVAAPDVVPWLDDEPAAGWH